MTKPTDLSKFRQSITKSIKGMTTGFHDPKTWVGTNNYCLNYLISGDFFKGIPLGKVTVFAGESGSGKSYLCSGNVVKNAQKEGIFVVLLDSENALDEEWLKNVGVDTSEDRLLRIPVTYVNDVGKVISDVMKTYKGDYDGSDSAPKLLFVVDSLGMLLTPNDHDQFERGDMKGDMGLKAKQLTALVRNLVNLIAPYDVGVLATNHTYASQDMFDPDDKISGGQGFIYASSIVVASKKKKLKDKDVGGSTTQVLGIKASCKVMKSRYSKANETVDIFIPYNGGIDPYSGLFELFEGFGILKRVGNRYTYVSKETGEEFTEFKKNMDSKFFDRIMNEFHLPEKTPEESEETTTDDE